jgi:hypothetical protein
VGALNKSWSTIWVGTANVNCSNVTLFSENEEIHTIYQVHQSGDRFVDQIVSESDNMFANIRTIKCGSGIIVKTINGNAEVPNIVESSSTSGLVTPNFPMDIIISGLDGDYTNGNGEYIITTFFQNDSPTYKSETGWLIKRNDDDYWYIYPPITNLLKLKGGNNGPVDSIYIQEDCSGSNCPSAKPIDKLNPNTPTPTPELQPTPTPTPQPTPTPTPISVSDIQVTIEDISDTSIELQYNILSPSVKMWETELSSDIEFKTKQTITGTPTTRFHEFKNLNHSTIYYCRTRVYNESERASPWINVLTNTTIPAISANPTISLTNEKFPKINWIKPSVDFEYDIEVVRTPEHTDVIILNGASTSQFIDSTATQEIEYTYRISFVSKNFKGSHLNLSIKIDKTAPIPPVLVPTNLATNKRELVFEWNTNTDVGHYLYKFNTSEWVKYKGNKLTIRGEEGENIFRIMSIDSSGNRSVEITRKILIDITKPTPPVIISPTDVSSTEIRQKFEWSISDSDITFVSYKVNNGVWNVVGKSITSVILDLIQGKNSFKVKAIDHVGNESDISSLEIRVDSVPPPKPILKRIEDIADITDNVTYDWSSSNKGDVTKWEYSFTKWGYGSTQPKSVWNNFLNVSTLKKNFLVNEGYILFEIRAIDEHENISEVASDLIDIDTNPPQMPTLEEPVVRTNEDKTATALYKWTISSDTHKVVFNLNNGTLIEKRRTEDQTHELKLNQGINRFQIYAEDARGNKSNKNVVDTMIDTLPANPPKILDPFGECPVTLWKKLWEACQSSKNGEQSSVRITYSFIPPDKNIGNFHAVGKSRTTTFQSKGLPNVPNMISHIDDAFESWSSIIEDAFPNVDVNFENIGYETTNIPSAKNVMFKQSDQGDIRIAFVSNYEEFSEFVDRRYDNNSNFKTGASDIYVNTELNWSQPNKSTSSSIDIRLGMRHYIGKSLGLVENKNLTKGTSYLRSGTFNETEDTNADKNRFLTIYSLPSKHENIASQTIENSIKYVNSNDLNISFSSDERVTIEYKYDFLSNSNSSLIIKSGQWNLHQPNDVKSGQIDLRSVIQSESPSNKIRFYIRSMDSTGNKSDVNYCDYTILNTSDPCGISSVVEYCEQNPSLRVGNSCWDGYGLYSCMAAVNRPLVNSEVITLRLKPTSYDFYILTRNINLVAHSLFPDMEYTVDGYVNPNLVNINEASEGVNYGFVNLTNLTAKQFKTQNSDKTPPSPVAVLYINHATEVHPKQYTTPVGQLRKNGKYVPAMEIGWSRSLENDFYKYELVVSESPIFASGVLTKTFSYPHRDKVKEIIYLDKYSTDYYVKILAYDKSNNVSSSNIKVYKTVEINDPPKITGDFNIEYATINGFQIKYNEVPESKWTIGFRFPHPTDLQFPGLHMTPDVEDGLRQDYTDSDWLSLLGHLPLRIESKQWPGQSATTSPTGYWISRNSVRDDNHKKLNNHSPIIDSSGSILFRLSEYEADTEYVVTMFIYDLTGHYIEKRYSFKTKEIEGDVTSPPKPSFDINAVTYYNGTDFNGDDISNLQWVLRFSWTLKSTSDLSKFLLLSKEDGIGDFAGGYLSVDKLEKTSDGSINTYTGMVSGWKPNTKHLFKYNSIDTSDNWSEQGTFEFTTPIGDMTNPPRPSISDVIRIVHSEYGNSFVFKIGQIVDPGVSLMIYLTKNLSEQNFYNFESKWRLDKSNIEWDKWHLIGELEDNVVYKVGFAWIDSAYNWSSVFYINLPKEAQVLDSSNIMGENALQSNIEFKLVNKISDF